MHLFLSTYYIANKNNRIATIAEFQAKTDAFQLKSSIYLLKNKYRSFRAAVLNLIIICFYFFLRAFFSALWRSRA